MATILVVDDEPIVREPIAAMLRTRGYVVHCAANVRMALGSLSEARPDLILLDLQMPDTDGLAFLRSLRAEDATSPIPTILLTNSSQKSAILQAARIGVEGYILKAAFSITELLARIEKLLQPPKVAVPDTKILSSKSSTVSQAHPVIGKTEIPKLLTREKTLERLEQVAGGKTLAGVVARLISVASSPDAALGDVVQVIQSDPILAARVMQLANSASTGSRCRIRNVEDAARNVGVRGIHGMAVSIGIFAAFPPEEHDGFNSMRCWQHSFAVAELLPLLLLKQNSEQESVNHLVGLCHDLGEILLRQHFAEEYTQVLNYALANDLPVAEVEATALGIRHADLVARLLTCIGLPAAVVGAIREFHDRQNRDEAAGMGPNTQALLFANLAAHGMLLVASPHEKVRPITRAEWRQFSADQVPPVFDLGAKRTEILTATSILARLPPGDEARMIEPTIPRQNKRVWYARPDHFLDFDPLA
ncbi:MAG TPA: HDOD domain-containing protein, partial [Tepidisphaeraceae bacterium]|nr:HDOD domain-containing protein [Tepidisphaeraceae bacterium]